MVSSALARLLMTLEYYRNSVESSAEPEFEMFWINTIILFSLCIDNIKKKAEDKLEKHAF